MRLEEGQKRQRQLPVVLEIRIATRRQVAFRCGNRRVQAAQMAKQRQRPGVIEHRCEPPAASGRKSSDFAADSPREGSHSDYC